METAIFKQAIYSNSDMYAYILGEKINKKLYTLLFMT
jgi:hypothetical protein